MDWREVPGTVLDEYSDKHKPVLPCSHHHTIVCILASKVDRRKNWLDVALYSSTQKVEA